MWQVLWPSKARVMKMIYEWMMMFTIQLLSTVLWKPLNLMEETSNHPTYYITNHNYHTNKQTRSDPNPHQRPWDMTGGSLRKACAALCSCSRWCLKAFSTSRQPPVQPVLANSWAVSKRSSKQQVISAGFMACSELVECSGVYLVLYPYL